MSKCLWCEEEVLYTISIRELVLFHCNKRPLCQVCCGQLVRLDDYPMCLGCSRKVCEKEELCQDCIGWRKIYPHLELNHRAMYDYNAFGKEIISRFKFSGDCELAAVFSEEIKELASGFGRRALIIPIPISRNSLKVRGFNQTDLLLEAANLPFQHLLESSDRHEKQSKKNRAERLNSAQPFTVREGMSERIKGKHLLIADDIYTTGRTIYHAADLLSSYQPASINSLSVFR